MKEVVYIFILLLAFAACNTSPEREALPDVMQISTHPNWGESVVVKLELEKNRFTSNNGIRKSATSYADIVLQIDKNEYDTWLCKWKVENIRMPKINNLLEKKIEELTKGFTYEFILDSTGVIDLLNWQEIRQRGEQALNLLLKEVEIMQQITPEQLENISSIVSGMFDTKEKIETYMIQDAQLYFAVSGIEMNKYDTITTPLITTNPLTGDPIIQNMKIIFQQAYSDASCDIQVLQTVDTTSFSSNIKSTMDKFGTVNNNTNQLKQELDSLTFEVSIKTNYNISTATGLVNTVVSEKKIKVGKQERIDKITIRKK